MISQLSSALQILIWSPKSNILVFNTDVIFNCIMNIRKSEIHNSRQSIIFYYDKKKLVSSAALPSMNYILCLVFGQRSFIWLCCLWSRRSFFFIYNRQKWLLVLPSKIVLLHFLSVSCFERSQISVFYHRVKKFLLFLLTIFLATKSVVDEQLKCK